MYMYNIILQINYIYILHRCHSRLCFLLLFPNNMSPSSWHRPPPKKKQQQQQQQQQTWVEKDRF